MEAWIRFPVFILASYHVFGAVVCFVLRRRDHMPGLTRILGIGFLVIVGGMSFAKFGQNAGWPWWIYYTVPMLLAVFLLPLYFRMSRREVPVYLLLELLVGPGCAFVLLVAGRMEGLHAVSGSTVIMGVAGLKEDTQPTYEFFAGVSMLLK